MQTIVDAVIESVNQQETEQEKRKFLTSTLIELSTSFSGTLFADCIRDMEDYWAEQES